MKTNTIACIGATIAIVASVPISSHVFHIATVDIHRSLGMVGFWFLVGLPTYIWYTRRKNKERRVTINEQCRRLLRYRKLLEEIGEMLDASIVGFQQWGWYVKNYDKVDEEAYYAEIALWREAGAYTGGLSAEYGEDVSYLIRVRSMLEHIKQDLEYA